MNLELRMELGERNSLRTRNQSLNVMSLSIHTGKFYFLCQSRSPRHLCLAEPTSVGSERKVGSDRMQLENHYSNRLMPVTGTLSESYRGSCWADHVYAMEYRPEWSTFTQQENPGGLHKWSLASMRISETWNHSRRTRLSSAANTFGSNASKFHLSYWIWSLTAYHQRCATAKFSGYPKYIFMVVWCERLDRWMEYAVSAKSVETRKRKVWFTKAVRQASFLPFLLLRFHTAMRTAQNLLICRMDGSKLGRLSLDMRLSRYAWSYRIIQAISLHVDRSEPCLTVELGRYYEHDIIDEPEHIQIFQVACSRSPQKRSFSYQEDNYHQNISS